MSRDVRKLAKRVKDLQQLVKYIDERLWALERADDGDAWPRMSEPAPPVDCTMPPKAEPVNEELAALRALKDAVLEIGTPEDWRVSDRTGRLLYHRQGLGDSIARRLDTIAKEEGK